MKRFAILQMAALALVASGCCNGTPVTTADWIESFEGDCAGCVWSFEGDHSIVGTFHPGEHAHRLQPGSALETTFSAAGTAELTLLTRCDAGGQVHVTHSTTEGTCSASVIDFGAENTVSRNSPGVRSQPRAPVTEAQILGSEKWVKQTVPLRLRPGGGAGIRTPVTLRLANLGNGACDIDQVHYTATTSGCDGCQ